MVGGQTAIGNHGAQVMSHFHDAASGDIKNEVFVGISVKRQDVGCICVLEGCDGNDIDAAIAVYGQGSLNISEGHGGWESTERSRSLLSVSHGGTKIIGKAGRRAGTE